MINEQVPATERHRPGKPVWQFVAFFVVAVVCVGSARAQLPHIRLDGVFPPGGKAGTHVEVQLQGADLDDVDRLLFSHPGLTAEAKIAKPSELTNQPRRVPNVFMVRIADSVPEGLYEVRAIGYFGISNPRWFHVDRQGNVVESSDNMTADKAMLVPLGTTVSGRADSDRIDYFRIPAKAGERLTIDCQAERLDSRMDGTLILFDPAGREMHRVRDTHGHDPVLAFAAPVDGEYTLAVYDFIYRGGTDYFYRLSVHGGPHVTHVFPPSVLPGAQTTVTLFGYNLPAGKPVERSSSAAALLEQVDVEVNLPEPQTLLAAGEPGAYLSPSYSTLDGWLYQYNTATDRSNRVMIGRARAPVVAEVEPNDDPQRATPVAVPCEFVGQFAMRGDRDWASFTASKGQVLWIEVICHRVGVRCDPVIRVEKVTVDAQGQERVSQVTGLDDTDPPANNDPSQLLRARSDDPVYRLAVDQDATYRVQVRDLYGAPRAGSHMVYRLVINEHKPDFQLVAYPLPADRRDRNKVYTSSPVLRRGGTVAYEVRCFRTHGFDGEVEVTAEGLPSGVTCDGALVGGRANQTILVLAADENAPAWAGTVQIVGRATVGDQQVQRTACTAAVVCRADNLRDSTWNTRLTQQMGLAVMGGETAAAQITAGDGNIVEMSIGGRTEVPLKVAKRAEFAPAGTPVIDGLPREVQVKSTQITDANAKVELSFANTQIRPGAYTFCVRAPVKQKRVRNAAAIAAAQAEAIRLAQIVKEKTEQIGQVTEAEKAQAEVSLKEAQRLKSEADKRLTDITNTNKEREFTYELSSTPVKIRVRPTPIAITTNPAHVTVRKGAKASVEVIVERKYGFDDKVDITLVPPPGIGGVAAPPISVAKGQTNGTVEITANDQANPGEHAFELSGKLKFNNVSLEQKHALMIEVEGD
jgi:hypothetical protein